MTRGPSMSEFAGQLSGDLAMTQDESLQDEPGVSAGTLLRQAREAAGLHIVALAVALKVPVKKLEALEADRLDSLPDAVFVRALAASVCRTLKIDAAQVLALLPQTGKPRLDYQKTGINTPFRSPGDGPGPSSWAQISRPAILAGLLLLLGALVLIFLPTVPQQGAVVVQPVSAPSSAVSLAAEPQVAQATPPAQSDVVMASTKPLIAGSALESPTPAATLAAAPVSVPGQLAQPALAWPGATLGAASPNLPTAGPAASVPAALAQPAPTGIMVFKAIGESWVEVTDAKGIVVLRRILTPGEVVGASGALPLAAVVGRVDATQVQVRGRAFDLNAVSKDNVARFEVK